ncbi:MAG: alpha/beta hydrolase [Kofleriaceae bacterium]|nr:alpha/beta hydrolase [Kofleriaceae bacterium]
MTPALHVVRAGVGPRILLIHGSAADHTTWSIQLNSPALRGDFSLIAYDRRAVTTVEEHADDAASLLADANQRALLVGSSFGAVVALDVLRRYPERCAGAVLIEPPMAADDATPVAAAEFLATFDRCVEEQGGPAAGALFLRTVLGDAAYERIPRAFRERSAAKWKEIRADSVALIAYRPRYAELANVRVPVQLLGGGRSASYFRPTLEALLQALPAAQLEIVDHAGHMLHAEASRRFAEVLTAFAGEVLPMAETTG